MTSKSDCHYILELDEKFTPAQFGVVNLDEIGLIAEVLELEKRNDIELHNIRDMVVMFYMNRADDRMFAKTHQEDREHVGLKKPTDYTDKMSAIVAVIYREFFKRGTR